ncbi:MAG: histidine kinase, partial [Pirellulales bacterium]|nr:histidine kinase [Pirellulales bacterium]
MPVHNSPDDFLELVQERKRGRLKLYIGYAAGVGKTWQILKEAHALRERGVDLVVGLIEPHGRAETASLVGDLEIVPPRRTEYRGLVVEDMDLGGVIARRPEVAVVDEIPHTNVPGSRHNKRYQDVLEILEAGIHVIGALDIQHLESLKDIVERATGVKIRETVPDTFLKRADQIVNVDLTVEDLRDRLENGKIYPQEQVAAALEGLFRETNLATLRELALREVAESVERRAPEQPDRDPAHASGARVMVCVASYSPRAAALLRRASR